MAANAIQRFLSGTASSSKRTPANQSNKGKKEHGDKLKAFTTISTVISHIQHHQKFQLTAESKSKLSKEEKGGLAICSSFATIAVMEHEIVAVGVNYKDHTHDASSPTKAVDATTPPSTTTDDWVYEWEEDEDEDEDSTYIPKVVYEQLMLTFTLNPRRDKPTPSKDGKLPTSSAHPAIRSPEMPEALRKRGNFEGDSPKQVAEHDFDQYLQSIITEGSVPRLSIFLRHILRICSIGTPQSHFLSTFGYWRRF